MKHGKGSWIKEMSCNHVNTNVDSHPPINSCLFGHTSQNCTLSLNIDHLLSWPVILSIFRDRKDTCLKGHAHNRALAPSTIAHSLLYNPFLILNLILSPQLIMSTKVNVLSHPVVNARLSQLREISTSAKEFREVTNIPINCLWMPLSIWRKPPGHPSNQYVPWDWSKQNIRRIHISRRMQISILFVCDSDFRVIY